MHFIVFTGGKPIEVHKFTHLDTPNYYVYTPPARPKPYVFKAGRCDESIYAVLFPLTQDERNQLIDRYNHVGLRNKKYPSRLDASVQILDLMFAKTVDDYAPVLRQLIDALGDNVTLVTNRGVRGRSTLKHADCAVKENAVLAIKEDAVDAEYFMRIVDRNISTHGQSTQEAFNNAAATGVIGEFVYAKPPRWWVTGESYYGEKSTADNT